MGTWSLWEGYPFSYYSVLIREPKKKKGERVLLENLASIPRSRLCVAAGMLEAMIRRFLQFPPLQPDKHIKCMSICAYEQTPLNHVCNACVYIDINK